MRSSIYTPELTCRLSSNCAGVPAEALQPELFLSLPPMPSRALHLLFALGLFTASVAQDVVVYGKVRDLSSRAPLAGGVVTLKNDDGVPVDRWVVGDSGNYEFHLALDSAYELHFGAADYFPKWLVMDLRHIDASEEEREGGWGMNVDASLTPWFPGVEDSLIDMPYGRASWSSADTGIVWDMEHTQRMRDAWAPLNALIMESDVPARRATPRIPNWALFVLTLVLLLLQGLWHFGKLKVRPVLQVPLLVIMLAAAMLCGAYAIPKWIAFGWTGDMVVGCAILALVLLIGSYTLFWVIMERLMPEDFEALEEDRDRAQRNLRRSDNVVFWIVLFCGIGLYYSLDHTLHPEVYFLRYAGWALVLFLVLALVLFRPVQRWPIGRVPRLRFWVKLLFALLVVIPVAILFVDRAQEQITGTRQAEIIELSETHGRRGKVTFYATVLVDGREKEFTLELDEWDELTSTDALELSIAQGPFGIERIAGHSLILRNAEGQESDEMDEAE